MPSVRKLSRYVRKRGHRGSKAFHRSRFDGWSAPRAGTWISSTSSVMATAKTPSLSAPSRSSDRPAIWLYERLTPLLPECEAGPLIVLPDELDAGQLADLDFGHPHHASLHQVTRHAFTVDVSEGRVGVQERASFAHRDVAHEPNQFVVARGGHFLVLERGLVVV